MGIYSTIDRVVNRILPDEWIKSFAKVMKLETHSDAPWASFDKPYSESRIALISSAGVHLKSDGPFDMEDRDGDPTFRMVPGDVESGDLTVSHSHYNTADALKDINVVFPIDRLREMVRRELIGSVAPRNFGFMGFIPKVEPLLKKYAPQVAGMLKEDQVDAVVLAPA